MQRRRADSVYDLAFGVTNQDPGQNIYGNSRPPQVAPDRINLFDPTALNGLTTNPAHPSGHTNYAFTDSILLAMLVPELYQSMVMRASEYGNSRLVLGVHYALDVIGSRTYATYELAQYLSNPAYINNAAVTGTAVDLPSLFTAAQSELRAYLQAQGAAQGCGATIAACATSAANTANNPLMPSAANQALYQSRLTYGLPILSFAEAPREAAPAGAADASILLASLYGGSTAAAQTLAPGGGIYGNLQTSTINQIIVNTETNAIAAYYGTTFSYWSRIDLYSAAGYFQNVTGTLALAPSDVVKTNVSVGSDGIFGGAGTVQGNTAVNSGGTLAPTASANPGVIGGPGTLTIQGNLQFNSGSRYAVQLTPAAASLTSVSGATAIADGTQMSANLARGIYTIGSTMPVLTTAGAMSGQFSSFSYTNTGANVRPVVSYDAQDVYLTLLQAQLPAASAGQAGNAAGVQSALNAYIAGGGVLPASFQNLYPLSPAALASTLNQMAGQSGTAAAQSAFASMNGFLGSIFGFVGGGGDQPAAGAIAFAPEPNVSPEVARAYAAVTPKDRLYAKAPAGPVWAAPSWGFWGSGFGGVTRLDGDVAVGSQEITSRIAGGAAGADYLLFPNTKIGFALAGGETSFSLAQGYGSGRSDFFQGSVYGKSYFGPAYVTGAVAGGAQWVNTDRTVIIGPAFDHLTASYTLPVLAGRLEGGYRWFSVPSFGVTPYAAVQAQTAFLPGYVETAVAGTGASANAVTSKDVTAVRSELGAWFDTRLGWLTANGVLLRARAAWVHEYERNAAVSAQFATLPGTTFLATGAQLPANAALLSGVIEVPITPFMTISGKFDSEFGAGASTWAGTGKVRWVW